MLKWYAIVQKQIDDKKPQNWLHQVAVAVAVRSGSGSAATFYGRVAVAVARYFFWQGAVAVARYGKSGSGQWSGKKGQTWVTWVDKS